MATITVAQARFLGNKYGLPATTKGGPERPNIKETASQTYNAGDPVAKDSNGTIALATATSNILNAFAGFAIKDATGTTGAEARYRPVKAGDRYLMNIQGTSTDTTNQNQEGDKYMLDLDSSNLVVNPDATFDATKPYVIVETLFTVAAGFPDGDAAGDTNGRVIVWFPDQQALQG